MRHLKMLFSLTTVTLAFAMPSLAGAKPTKVDVAKFVNHYASSEENAERACLALFQRDVTFFDWQPPSPDQLQKRGAYTALICTLVYEYNSNRDGYLAPLTGLFEKISTALHHPSSPSFLLATIEDLPIFAEVFRNQEYLRLKTELVDAMLNNEFGAPFFIQALKASTYGHLDRQAQLRILRMATRPELFEARATIYVHVLDALTYHDNLKFDFFTSEDRALFIQLMIETLDRHSRLDPTESFILYKMTLYSSLAILAANPQLQTAELWTKLISIDHQYSGQERITSLIAVGLLSNPQGLAKQNPFRQILLNHLIRDYFEHEEYGSIMVSNAEFTQSILRWGSALKPPEREALITAMTQRINTCPDKGEHVICGIISQGALALLGAQQKQGAQNALDSILMVIASQKPINVSTGKIYPQLNALIETVSQTPQASAHIESTILLSHISQLSGQIIDAIRAYAQSNPNELPCGAIDAGAHNWNSLEFLMAFLKNMDLSADQQSELTALRRRAKEASDLLWKKPKTCLPNGYYELSVGLLNTLNP